LETTCERLSWQLGTLINSASAAEIRRGFVNAFVVDVDLDLSTASSLVCFVFLEALLTAEEATDFLDDALDAEVALGLEVFTLTFTLVGFGLGFGSGGGGASVAVGVFFGKLVDVLHMLRQKMLIRSQIIT